MHPTEVNWLIEHHQSKRRYGKMSEAEVAEIYEEAYGDGG